MVVAGWLISPTTGLSYSYARSDSWLTDWYAINFQDSFLISSESHNHNWGSNSWGH